MMIQVGRISPPDCHYGTFESLGRTIAIRKCMKIHVRKREHKIEGNTKDKQCPKGEVWSECYKRNALRILRKFWRKFGEKCPAIERKCVEQTSGAYIPP